MTPQRWRLLNALGKPSPTGSSRLLHTLAAARYAAQEPGTSFCRRAFVAGTSACVTALASMRSRPSAYQMRPLMLPQKAVARDQPGGGHTDTRYVTALPEAPAKRQKHAHAEAEATGMSPLHALTLSL